jgi:3-deoxy-D-manno-octulosonic-acid transferase
MSEGSYRRWARLPASAAELLGGFALCLAQSDADRARLAALGAKQVLTAGNLKYAGSPLPTDPAALAGLTAAIGERPVWLAASTHPGEETKVLEAHRRLTASLPDLLTMIAPRDPGRGGALAQSMRQMGFAVVRRSGGESPSDGCAIYLADTLGELGLWYRLAWIALVGGSLVPHGGQNPLEPARLGCPMLLGPHHQNFAEIGQQLVQAGAARRVVNDADLLATLRALLPDRASRARMAAAGFAVASRAALIGAETHAKLAPLLARAVGPVDAGA